MSLEQARHYSYSFVASITGILMTFRNSPHKSRQAVRDHIIKTVKLTSELYESQLLDTLKQKPVSG